MSFRLLTGDVVDQLRTLADESVHCVVTSLATIECGIKLAEDTIAKAEGSSR